MKKLYGLTLLILSLSVYTSAYTQCVQTAGVNEDITLQSLTTCLNNAGCSTGTTGCSITLSDGSYDIKTEIDLSGDYPGLTFTIASDASLKLFNNGMNVGELTLDENSTLIVEAGGALTTNNQNAFQITIGATSYIGSEFPSIVNAGGATESGVLPIELLFFEVELKGNQTHLHWRTATELNNDYMAVEHSTDGRRYSEIGRVLGAGTTQEPQDYSFMHEAPAQGINYYRLRQVDYDGQYEYHGPVTARFGNAASVLDIFPTATADELTVTYEGQLDHDATLSIQSTQGRTMRQWAWDSKSGRRASFSVADLPAGWYVLRLRNGREVVAGRFLKQ